jgi:TP901-1 family phage major tail protein
MSGQKGRDLLIRIADASGSFTTLAGLRTTRLQLSSALVDGTSAESEDAWRELIAGAGLRSAQISGRGLFKDAASDARLRGVFFAGEAPLFQFVLPHFGVIEGAFVIRDLSWSGAHDGEAEFLITLESAGALNFTVLP